MFQRKWYKRYIECEVHFSSFKIGKVDLMVKMFVSGVEKEIIPGGSLKHVVFKKTTKFI